MTLRATARGALAAATQLAVYELAASAMPQAGPPVAAVARAIIDGLPAPALEVAIALFERRDKLLLGSGVVAAHLAVGAGAGVAADRRPALGTAVLAGLGLGSAGLAVSRPEYRAGPSLVAGVGAATAGSLTLRSLTRSRRPVRASASVGLAAATLATARAYLGRSTVSDAQRPAEDAQSFDRLGLAEPVTSTSRFFVTDVAFGPPPVDLDTWRLVADGAVERPLALSLGDLARMPRTELCSTLVCVHNPVGGHRVGTAWWAGVDVRYVLDAAAPDPSCDLLTAWSVDGFSASIPLEMLIDRPGLLALEMNGRPLPPAHGYPARLIVPGLWGADASPKWLARLEFTTTAKAGPDYWERRGWPRRPTPVTPAARIDVCGDTLEDNPRTLVAAGFAWAPPGGVEAVEVAIDDGPWQRAQLGTELAPTAWRQWQIRWTPTAASHTVSARAIGRDDRQTGRQAAPYPAGASGYHRVEVRVQKDGRPPVVVTNQIATRLGRAARSLRAWGDHADADRTTDVGNP